MEPLVFYSGVKGQAMMDDGLLNEDEPLPVLKFVYDCVCVSVRECVCVCDWILHTFPPFVFLFLTFILI